MSRLTVTAEELSDVKRLWTGEELFKLSNAQLNEIAAARSIAVGGEANKKELVKAILDNGGSDLEVVKQNADAAASTFSAGRMAGGIEADNVEFTEREVVVKPPVDMLLGSGKFDAVIDIGGNAVQLGSIVANAQAGSGLNAIEWNALGDEERDQYIEAAIHEMRRSENNRLKELDDKMAQVKAKKEQKVFKGLFEPKPVAAEGGKEAQTHFGHIDDLPNPLAAKA